VQDSTLDIIYFSDIIVFPQPLLDLYPEVYNASTSHTILYNEVTEYLLQLMMEEWFQEWPETDGIMVQTGVIGDCHRV
jgi:hypothetical protein